MSGLDPVGRRDVRELILGLRDQGRTVLFSSHILSDAEMLCSRVAILVKGRLAACGSIKRADLGQQLTRLGNRGQSLASWRAGAADARHPQEHSHCR